MAAADYIVSRTIKPLIIETVAGDKPTAYADGKPVENGTEYLGLDGSSSFFNGTIWVTRVIGAVSIDPGDIHLGAMEITDADDDTKRAKVDVGSSVATTDKALAVVDPNSKVGAATLATSTVAIDTTVGGTLLIAARTGRRGVLLTNLGTQIVYVGQGTITSANAPLYPNGSSKWYPITGQLKALSASGSQNIGVEEVY